MVAVVDMTGRTVGCWKVLHRSDDGSGRAKWYCKCLKCGVEKALYGTTLRLDASESGCRACHKKGKCSEFPDEYSHWVDMKTRVTNKNRPTYARYSELGMHPEWISSFESFIAHIGPKPADNKSVYSVDRIDNEIGYFPGNVRWATREEQGRNTRRNLWVEVKGERMVLLDAAPLLGIPYNTLRDWVLASVFNEKIKTRSEIHAVQL